ncbi:MAG: 4a-hydroxytetrahydrobiopterin dehydratase [Thermoleophilaceae bacterium]|jgi:4a-hydroxytetrahydrobiopterin dehydratase
MAVLSDDEIQERLGGVDGWQRDGDALRKEFDRGDFKGSVDFVNRITPAAEEMNHHPDLTISWSKVTVSLSTHSQGGITEGDFELARKIDEQA